MEKRAFKNLTFAVASLCVLASCGAERAELAVQLEAPAAATPLVFHGSCFAGFLLGFELRVIETEGTGLDLEALSFEVHDAATAEILGSEALAGADLRDRYGAAALHLPPHGSRVFPVSVRVSGPGRLSLTVVGEVRGADSTGLVRQPYRLDLGEVLLQEPGPSGGGACSPGSGS